MILIGLTGKARCGKDTAATYLNQKFGCEVFALADRLKAGLRAMFNLSEIHINGALKEEVIPWLGVSPRDLMQTLGTEWGRNMIGPAVWTSVLDQQFAIHEHWAGRNGSVFVAVVSDIRFDNEADWVRSKNGIVLHIERDNAQPVKAHISEQGVIKNENDLTVPNNASLTEFYQRLHDVLIGELSARGYYD